MPYGLLGFGRRHSNIGATNWLQTLYEQARVNQRLLTFEVLNTTVHGSLVIGEPLTPYTMIYYPVLEDSAGWIMPLHNIEVGSTSLGYNGRVEVIVNSPYHVVNQVTWGAITSLLNLSQIEVQQQFGIYQGTFDCPDDLFNALPNITYSLSGLPLTLTRDNYVMRNLTNCTLGFVYLSDSAIYNPLYNSLGWLMLINRNASFDFEQTRFGASVPLSIS